MQYGLRKLPDDLWARFRARAGAEGWSKRALFLQLLEDYAGGRLTLSAKPLKEHIRQDIDTTNRV